MGAKAEATKKEAAKGDPKDAGKEPLMSGNSKEKHCNGMKIKVMRTVDKDTRSDENSIHRIDSNMVDIAAEIVAAVTDCTYEENTEEKEGWIASSQNLKLASSNKGTKKLQKAKKKQKKEQKKRGLAKENESRNNAKKKKQSDGPWTQEEKRLYEQGFEMCGQVWGEISSNYVTSRTPLQIRHYAKSLLSQDINEKKQ